MCSFLSVHIGKVTARFVFMNCERVTTTSSFSNQIFTVTEPAELEPHGTSNSHFALGP